MVVKKNTGILLLALLIFIGCGKKDENLNSKLLMRSPFGCTHIVEIKNNGQYKISAGYEKDYQAKFTVFENIIKEADFKVTNKEDLDSINDLILNLRNRDILMTKKMKDVLHYELYINDEKKVDAYARKSKEINLIRDIIERHYPFDVDYFCDSYEEKNNIQD